eukprot:3114655-Prymnesium_polylepis.1
MSTWRRHAFAALTMMEAVLEDEALSASAVAALDTKAKLLTSLGAIRQRRAQADGAGMGIPLGGGAPPAAARMPTVSFAPAAAGLTAARQQILNA